MQISKTHAIGAQEFVDQYLVRGRPLIVTGALDQWDLFWEPAEWSRRFGEELAQVYDDSFNLVDVMALSAYLSKFFGNKQMEGTARPKPYLRWYAKMKDVDFFWADKVFDQIAGNWALPAFLPDTDYLFPNSHGRSLNPAKDAYPAKGLFISGSGARTKLHQDPWASDAVLCQLFGEKRVVFFSPDQRPLLTRGQKVFDIDKPDIQAFPAANGLQPVYDDVLKTGEALFIPSGWMHHVTSISDSISMTWNFVHNSTWKRFFEHITSGQIEEELAVLRYFASLP